MNWKKIKSKVLLMYDSKEQEKQKKRKEKDFFFFFLLFLFNLFVVFSPNPFCFQLIINWWFVSMLFHVRSNFFLFQSFFFHIGWNFSWNTIFFNLTTDNENYFKNLRFFFFFYASIINCFNFSNASILFLYCVLYLLDVTINSPLLFNLDWSKKKKIKIFVCQFHSILLILYEQFQFFLLLHLESSQQLKYWIVNQLWYLLYLHFDHLHIDVCLNRFF